MRPVTLLLLEDSQDLNLLSNTVTYVPKIIDQGNTSCLSLYARIGQGREM